MSDVEEKRRVFEAARDAWWKKKEDSRFVEAAEMCNEKAEAPIAKPKVLVSIPNTGNICTELVAMLFRLWDDPRYDVDISFPMEQPSEACRSKALIEFMQSDRTWWLSIDSDQPPSTNPLDLIDLDLDLVGCPGEIWRHYRGEPTLRWSAYKRVRDGFQHLPMKPGALEAVDAISTGCFLAHRRIFTPELLEQPFQRVWRKDGTVEIGSDLAFCDRVRAAGFQIYVHWGHPCNHFKTINLAEVMAALAQARRGEGR